VPSSGFGRLGNSGSGASATVRTAMEKIRAIEDALAGMEEEQRIERKEAARKMMQTDHSSTLAASGSSKANNSRGGFAAPSDTGRYADRADAGRDRSPARTSGFVHPDRRRSRSPRAHRNG